MTRRRRSRLEKFGAIVSLADPQTLVFVDRARAIHLGIATSADFRGEQPELTETTLSAPLEVHLQLTNQCQVGCRGCYTSATPTGDKDELTEAKWQEVLRELARAGVFHVALGGGESADLPWLPSITRYARTLDIVPNLTTSGLSNLQTVFAALPHLEQVNVSLDGIGPYYQRARGGGRFADVDYAISQLRAVHKKTGINVVVTRHNFHHLPTIFAYARRKKLFEIELLRFKPSGRGAHQYERTRCSDAQHRGFWPLVKKLARRYRMRVRVDCSYVPMIASHGVSPEQLQSLAVMGCSGGDWLAAAKADGTLVGCSFAVPPKERPSVANLSSYWRRPEAFEWFRKWRQMPDPCRSCEFLDLCRGGCSAVSQHVLQNPASPDPECPRVVDYAAQNGTIKGGARLPIWRGVKR